MNWQEENNADKATDYIRWSVDRINELEKEVEELEDELKEAKETIRELERELANK